MKNLLLFNDFDPVISSPTSSKKKESDESLYGAVWSLVMVRNQLPVIK